MKQKLMVNLMVIREIKGTKETPDLKDLKGNLDQKVKKETRVTPAKMALVLQLKDLMILLKL